MLTLPSWYDNVAVLLARIFVGGFFLYAGIMKLANLAGTQQGFESLGLPAALLVVWVVIALELFGGAMILLGYKARLATLVLGIFTLATIPVAHAFWLDPAQTMTALKNIALAGGLLSMSAHGSGKWSIDEKRAMPPMVV